MSSFMEIPNASASDLVSITDKFIINPDLKDQADLKASIHRLGVLSALFTDDKHSDSKRLSTFATKLNKRDLQTIIKYEENLTDVLSHYMLFLFNKKQLTNATLGSDIKLLNEGIEYIKSVIEGVELSAISDDEKLNIKTILKTRAKGSEAAVNIAKKMQIIVENKSTLDDTDSTASSASTGTPTAGAGAPINPRIKELARAGSALLVFAMTPPPEGASGTFKESAWIRNPASTRALAMKGIALLDKA